MNNMTWPQAFAYIAIVLGPLALVAFMAWLGRGRR